MGGETRIVSDKADQQSRMAFRSLTGKSAGFSLVELVVVLFILSIVALAAVPGLSRSGIFHSSAGKERELAGLIRSLKLRAVKENCHLRLHLDSDGGKAWVSRGPDGSPLSASETGDETGADIVLENLPLRKVEILGRDFSGSSVLTFYSRGYSDAGVIVLGSGEAGVSLIIHPFLFDPEIVKGEISLNDCG